LGDLATVDGQPLMDVTCAGCAEDAVCLRMPNTRLDWSVHEEPRPYLFSRFRRLQAIVKRKLHGGQYVSVPSSVQARSDDWSSDRTGLRTTGPRSLFQVQSGFGELLPEVGPRQSDSRAERRHAIGSNPHPESFPNLEVFVGAPILRGLLWIRFVMGINLWT
jgi:hypothetical protein